MAQSPLEREQSGYHLSELTLCQYNYSLNDVQYKAITDVSGVSCTARNIKMVFAFLKNKQYGCENE